MACPWWDKDKHGFERSHREEHKGKSHEEYKGEKGGNNNGKMKDQKQPGKSYEQKQPEKSYERGYDKSYGSGYERGYDHGHSKSSGSSKYGDGHSGQGKSKKTVVHYCPANDVYKYDY